LVWINRKAAMLMSVYSVIAGSRRTLHQRIAPGLLNASIYFGGREAWAEVAKITA
jgi:hypothetical protein